MDVPALNELGGLREEAAMRTRVTLFRRGTFFWVYYRLGGRRIRQSLGTENRKIAESMRFDHESRLKPGEARVVQTFSWRRNAVLRLNSKADGGFGTRELARPSMVLRPTRRRGR